MSPALLDTAIKHIRDSMSSQYEVSLARLDACAA